LNVLKAFSKQKIVFKPRSILKNYLDHLWKQQAKGQATLSDLKELMEYADVSVLEISHELDTRLIELTKLNTKWFEKLGEYLKEEKMHHKTMQVNNFDRS